MSETHLINNDEIRQKLQIAGIIFGLLVLIAGIISIVIRIAS